MSEVKIITEKEAIEQLFAGSSEFTLKPVPVRAVKLQEKVSITVKNKQLECSPGDYLVLTETNSILKKDGEEFEEKYKPLGL